MKKILRFIVLGLILVSLASTATAQEDPKVLVTAYGTGDPYAFRGWKRNFLML